MLAHFRYQFDLMDQLLLWGIIQATVSHKVYAGKTCPYFNVPRTSAASYNVRYFLDSQFLVAIVLSVDGYLP